MHPFNRRHRKSVSLSDVMFGLFTMLFIVLLGLAEGM